MAKLEGLPLEVLQEVYVHLSTGALYVTADLSALSRASKILQPTIEPYLYQQVEWNWDDATPWRPEFFHPPILLLVRSFLNRPTLAKHVRTLTFRGDDNFTGALWGTEPYFTRNRVKKSIWGVNCSHLISELHTKECEVLMTAVKALSSSNWISRWLEEWAKGDVDILVAVLFSQISSLKHLNLDTEFQRYTILLSTQNEESLAFLSRPRFPVLESVALNAETLHQPVADKALRTDWFRQSHILSLLEYPSMRNLRMSLPAHVIFPPHDPSFSCSRLTSLTVVDSEFFESNLGRLLLRTPALKQLHYQKQFDAVYWVTPPGDGFHNFNCKEMGFSLWPLRNVLEKLILSVNPRGHPDLLVPPGGSCIHGRLESLSVFEKLKSVQVPFTMLMGCDSVVRYRLADCLPKNLWSLCLTDELRELEPPGQKWPALKAWVEEYVDERHDDAPELRGLTLEAKHVHGNWREGRKDMSWCEHD